MFLPVFSSFCTVFFPVYFEQFVVCYNVIVVAVVVIAKLMQHWITFLMPLFLAKTKKMNECVCTFGKQEKFAIIMKENIRKGVSTYFTYGVWCT